MFLQHIIAIRTTITPL